MPELTADHPRRVYRLKAHIYNLNHVWRRFHIAADSSLEDLRHAIVCLFGFREDFPYLLRVGNARYGPGEGADPAAVPLRDAVDTIRKATVRSQKSIFLSYESPEYREHVKAHGERIPREGTIVDESETEGVVLPEYLHWYIVISCEDELPEREGQPYPVCTAGERASPPDVIDNYDRYHWFTNTLKIMGRSRFTEALKKSGKPEDVKLVPLLEGGFDPAAFDIDDVNRCLSGSGKK